jgi:hypothetical protein
MDPYQPVHSSSLIRIHAVRLPTLLQVEKLTANSMDPDQTARMPGSMLLATHYVGFVMARLKLINCMNKHLIAKVGFRPCKDLYHY